jgi:hypothetical protein
MLRAQDSVVLQACMLLLQPLQLICCFMLQQSAAIKSQPISSVLAGGVHVVLPSPCQTGQVA